MARASRIGLHIINPNTSESVTRLVVHTARAKAGPDTVVNGFTASEGPSYITTSAQNTRAAREVLRILHAQDGGYDAAIIAAFTDPGLLEARSEISVPVFGMAEAAMRTASSLGGWFAIVTCVQRLGRVFTAHADALGYGTSLAGVWAEEADLASLGNDSGQLASFLAGIITRRLPGSGVTSVILGGAPFAGLDVQLTRMTGVPVLDGIACAVALAESEVILQRSKHKTNTPA